MIQAATLEDVYKLEQPVEEGFAGKLTAAQVKVFTRLNANDDFQKVRPRVELKVIVSGHTGEAFFKLLKNSYNVIEKHVAMFSFHMALQVTTELVKGDVQRHPNHVARVRSVLSRCERLDDEALMPFHIVLRFWPKGGTLPHLNQENGIEQSTLTYEGDVMIRDAAWPDLANL